MLKIRLMRIGKKNAPAYRVVLTEKQSKPQGKFQEILGNYNPRLNELKLKKDRILHWLSKGAQASDTVYNLLVKKNIIDSKKRAIKIKSKKKQKEDSAESAASDKKEKLESTAGAEVKEKPQKQDAAKKNNSSDAQKDAKADKSKAK